MKKTKLKYLAILLILVVNLNVKAQHLKTFNGRFETGIDITIPGRASYSYYDDKKSAQRIKQGEFMYNASAKNEINGSYTCKIIGSFDHGVKNGRWNYSKKFNDYNKMEGEHQQLNATGMVTLIASYKNGKPFGRWLYNKKIQYRDKRYIFGRVVTTPYKLYSDIAISVAFQDGLVTGPLSIKTDNYNISGSFDAKGDASGTWVVRSKDNEETTLYKNGLLIQRINRSLPNGEILEKMIDDKQVYALKEGYLNRSISLDQLEALGYEIKSLNIFDSKLVDLDKTIFNDADFMYSSILGDILINIDNNNNIKMKYLGGSFARLNKTRFLELALDLNFKKAEESFKISDLDNSLFYYRKVLANDWGSSIKSVDRKYIDAQINYIKVAQSQENRIIQKTHVELDNIFHSVFQAENKNKVDSILYNSAKYKPFNSGQIDDVTTAYVYFPICCLEKYRNDDGYLYNQFQVNFKNTLPQKILYWFDKVTGYSITTKFKVYLKEKGYHTEFNGWQDAKTGTGDISDKEYYEKNDPLKTNNFERIEVISNGNLSYRFCANRVVLITKF